MELRVRRHGRRGCAEGTLAHTTKRATRLAGACGLRSSEVEGAPMRERKRVREEEMVEPPHPRLSSPGEQIGGVGVGRISCRSTIHPTTQLPPFPHRWTSFSA